jgi:antirestriction protein ArdC
VGVPSTDYIGLPEAGAFATVADYWSTSLHEHAHWTGHASRLNRVGITRPDGYSREVYAYEELVAEISASFLCKHAGVDRPGLDDQHIAYLASWRKALTDDPSIIRKAVGEAGKVLRYLTK